MRLQFPPYNLDGPLRISQIVWILCILFSSTKSQVAPSNTDLLVQLVGGNKSDTYVSGALEISFDGDQGWMSVCDYYFQQNEVKVACGMMGFLHGQVVSDVLYPRSKSPPYPNHFSCDGSEAGLGFCEAFQDDVCEHSTQTIGLLCYNKTEEVLEMRLTQGTKSRTSLNGRLEVRLPDKPWGTVCDDLFNPESAKAACKYLGFEYGQRQDSHLGDTPVETYLDELNCEPGQSFFDCAHDPWGKHDCSYFEDVWLYCTNTTVRLLNAVPDDFRVGSVELFVTGEGWYEVCDQNWSDVEAKVACKELGYVDGKALCCNGLGAASYGSIDFYGSATNVKCKGDETELASCEWEETTLCPFKKDIIQLAATICYDKPVGEINMNLSTSLVPSSSDNPDAGLIQLRYMGVDGIICDEYHTFGDNESTVACRMLDNDFVGGKRLSPNLALNDTYHIWLRKVSNCTGTENTLKDCNISQWGEPGLGGPCISPVNVICFKQELKLTLVNQPGSEDDTGILQISYDGTTSSICADTWTNEEAHSACIALGYNGGQVWTPPENSTLVGVSSEFHLSGVTCERHTDFFMCENNGWGSVSQACKKTPIYAGVSCISSLKLEPGQNGQGAVQAYFEDEWRYFCHKEFDEIAADIVCQQLGFTHSTLLPFGSFGFVDTPSLGLFVRCNGTEKSLQECAIGHNYDTSCDYYSDYASVSCYNRTLETPDGTLSLENGYENLAVASGVLQIQINNTNFYVCNEFFTDNDADVACREYGKSKQLSYKGGIRFQPHEKLNHPFLTSHLTCEGTEDTILDCEGQENICYFKQAAAVLCYSSEAPKFLLQEGKGSIHSGLLQISINGELGSICADTWDDNDATVACLSLNEMYRGGIAMKLKSTGLPQFMSSFKCLGQENNLFECNSSSWKRLNSTCKTDAFDAGVICFTSVSLINGNFTDEYIFGDLEVKLYSSSYQVCSNDLFTDDLAHLVCEELGFEHASFLPASRLTDDYYVMKNIACTKDKKSISDCHYNIGYCSNSDGGVRLMCYKNQINALSRWKIKNNSYGRLMADDVYMPHFVGYACQHLWSDNDANDVCIEKGFKGGKALGDSIESEQEANEILWFGALTCQTENAVKYCSFENDVEGECSSSSISKAAGVLCYKNEDGISFRLMDHDRVAKHGGRVEIKYEGVWGTVCNKYSGRLQARTLCQQMGFRDGSVLNSVTTKRFGAGKGPIYLKDVQCSKDDKYFLGCPSAEGWNSATNCTHEDDLEIICYADVRLSTPSPESNYGEILQMKYGAYFAICNEGFTDTEAAVVCHQLGYSTGKSICCSQMDHNNPIGFREVKCDGTETSLTDCSHVFTDGTDCDSGVPASVACSFSSPMSDEYSLKLSNDSYGTLTIEYLGAEGIVCSDNFDHNDALVVCKEMGYSSGLRIASDDPGRMFTKALVWPFKAQCDGTETSLSACPGLEITSQKGHCSQMTDAYVHCLQSSDGPAGQLRLVGGRSNKEGRLEIQIEGVWGTVRPIYFDTLTTNTSNVICKQLGFVGGRPLAPGAFGSGPEKAWFSYIDCVGSESSIFECKLSNTQYYNHYSDGQEVAVECFNGVKLENSPDEHPERGELVIKTKTDTDWVHVCDTGISDTEATVACKTLGYTYGKKFCCSPAGNTEKNIPITSISCSGNEEDITACTINRQGGCNTDITAYIRCGNLPFTKENLTMSSMYDFIGVPKVTVYNVQGSICASNLEDKEAKVVCRELGYYDGILVKPKKLKNDDLIVITSLNCTGNEARLTKCSYNSLNFEDKCPDRLAAQVLCKESYEPVKFQISTGDDAESGKAEIIIDGNPYYLASISTNAYTATVFCKSVTNVSHSEGELITRFTPGTFGGRVLMTHVKCAPGAKSLFDCDAVYLPLYQWVSYSDLVYIKCHTGVELEGGDHPNSGMLVLNRAPVGFGTVCNSGFGQNELDVACRSLNYDFGIQHCCRTFGYNYYESAFKDIKCNGNERSLFDCKYVASSSPDEYLCNAQNYVGLSCFKGKKSNEFTVSLQGPNSQPNVGLVEIGYKDVPGTICSDEWDDKDASVVCKELGFVTGQAYLHFKSDFSQTAGPFLLSSVACTGNETRLADCPHSAIGDVKSCKSRHYAGVLCTNKNDIAFRIAGTNQPHFGRVEIKIDGMWGTICDRAWDSLDATVLCRQMGFNSGDVFDTEILEAGKGPVYEVEPYCSGKESRLNDCPHEGWFPDVTGSCANHRRDAGVFCYSSVRLGTGSGKSYNNGPVLIFNESKWYRVCDDGFNDITARKVCQELGYFDGKSICCSAYEGQSTILNSIHPNITLSCSNEEQTINDCQIYDVPCKSSFYASAACSEETDSFDDKEYTIEIDEDFTNAGRLKVTHYGVQGRICSSNWTDVDATVFCREKGLNAGIAYYHSYTESFVAASDIGPFWMSQVSCSGNESKLVDCAFSTRKDLGNCSSEHTASVVCYNEDGIHYRLSGVESKPNRGRVEMSLDNHWGTVCNEWWDEKDARVVCREQGYSDGVVIKNTYGRGTGPIWLHNIQCKGDESALHQCPHTGFQDEERTDSIFSFFLSPCRSHKNDAAAFCFKDTKLNQPLTQSSGGLLFNYNDKWRPVCGDSFSKDDSRVACKGLMNDYVDGLPIYGGRFGKVEGELLPKSFSCTGSEDSLTNCQQQDHGTCQQDYVSVACFKEALTADDLKFQLRLSTDSIRTADNHGILEVRQNGVWGRICMHEFTDKEATVACKELGFTGGNVYLHFFRNLLPILLSKTTCRGTESSLENCEISTDVDNENCAFESHDAGVVCHNNQGVEYRLSGQTSGRLEIGVEGNFGTVCQINWSKDDSKVLCRYLGHKDGIPLHETDYTLPKLKTLLSFFLCHGDEKSLLTCLNSGFDNGANSLLCGGDAYAACYDEEVRVTKIRLQSGKADNEGRLEVFVEPLKEWGTVCDDRWDDVNAGVVCRELGFGDGMTLSSSDVEPGTGKIFLDNVVCNGTESDLVSCKNGGINFHNCDHKEDVGIRCFNVTEPSPLPTAATSKPTTSSTTEKPVFSSSLPTSSTKLYTTPLRTRSTPKITTASTSTLPSKTTPKPTTQPPSSKPTTVTIPTSPQTEKSSTTSETGATPNSQRSSSSEDENKVVVAVSATVSVIAFIAIVVIVFIIYRYRIRPKSNYSHERFENESMEHSNDGSVAISNRMYGIENPDDPMSSYLADGTEIHLDRTGFASFSKGSPPNGNDDNLPDGFSNPLYAVQNQNGAGMDDIMVDMKNKGDTKFESDS